MVAAYALILGFMVFILLQAPAYPGITVQRCFKRVPAKKVHEHAGLDKEK